MCRTARRRKKEKKKKKKKKKKKTKKKICFFCFFSFFILFSPSTAVKPLTAGYHVLHGAALTFGDVLGLFDIEAFFPNPIAVKVFPRMLALRAHPVRNANGALHEQVGLHSVKRRGLSGELREIREHSHGDPFKFIAWKAPARRQQLME